MGILDFFNTQQNAWNAQQANSPYTPDMRLNAGMQSLGLLGGTMMAAGAPTTDPGAYGRIMGQGMAQRGPMMQQSLDQQLQQQDMMAEREREAAMQAYMESPEFGAGMSPEQMEFIRNAPPEIGMRLLGDSLFAQSDPLTDNMLGDYVTADGQVLTMPHADAIAQNLTPYDASDLAQTRLIESRIAGRNVNTTNVYGDEAVDEGLRFNMGLNQTDVQGAFDAAAQFQGLLPDLAAAESALSRIPEGGFLEPGIASEFRTTLARGAQFLGVENVEGLGSAELLESITKRLAPTMRAPGSGATSDMEFAAFEAALPSLSKTREGSLQIIGHLRDMAAFQGQMAQIKRQALMDTAQNPLAYDQRVKDLVFEVFGTADPTIGPSFSALVNNIGVVDSPAGTGISAEDEALINKYSGDQ